MPHKPLIVLTNDDGIASPGLHAAARALSDLGRLVVAAPAEQQSGMGRAMPRPVGGWSRASIAGLPEVEAWSVDASPALSVRWAMSTRLTRLPDLVVSGINFGENIGVSLGISGTVGAAWEAASFGPLAVAISLATDVEHHNSHSAAVDFGAAEAITRRIARIALARTLPPGTDMLNVNIPRDATSETPWRLTRVSRQRYYIDTVRDTGSDRIIDGYEIRVDSGALEPDADIRALALDGVVSISPLSIDPTALSVIGNTSLADIFEDTSAP